MKPEMKITILIVSAVLIWGGLLFFIGWRSNPKFKAEKVAEKALMATVDDPESVKILSVSRARSVKGHDYATEEEKASLSMAMMRINEVVMAETNGLEDFDPNDKATVRLMERQMAAMSELRSLISHEATHEQQPKKPFKGWKVKIECEGKSLDGTPFHSEYWFILDKDATCVVKSFEIPLV